MKRQIFHIAMRLFVLGFAELLVILFCAGLHAVFQMVVIGLTFIYWLIYMIYEVYYFHEERQSNKRNLSIGVVVVGLVIFGFILF